VDDDNWVITSEAPFEAFAMHDLVSHVSEVERGTRAIGLNHFTVTGLVPFNASTEVLFVVEDAELRGHLEKSAVGTLFQHCRK
jgi:hypothetical protein